MAENGDNYLNYKVDAASNWDSDSDKIAYIPPAAEANLHQVDSLGDADADDSDDAHNAEAAESLWEEALSGVAKILAPIIANPGIKAQGVKRPNTRKMASPLTLPGEFSAKSVKSAKSAKSMATSAKSLSRSTSVKALVVQHQSSAASPGPFTRSSIRPISKQLAETTQKVEPPIAAIPRLSTTTTASTTTTQAYKVESAQTDIQVDRLPNSSPQQLAPPTTSIKQPGLAVQTSQPPSSQGWLNGNPSDTSTTSSTKSVAKTTTSSPWYYFNPYASYNLYPTPGSSLGKRSAGVSVSKQRSLLRVASGLGLPISTIPAVLLTLFFLVPFIASIWEHLDEEWRCTNAAPAKSPASYAVGMRLDKMARRFVVGWFQH